MCCFAVLHNGVVPLHGVIRSHDSHPLCSRLAHDAFRRMTTLYMLLGMEQVVKEQERCLSTRHGRHRGKETFLRRDGRMYQRLRVMTKPQLMVGVLLIAASIFDHAAQRMRRGFRGLVLV